MTTWYTVAPIVIFAAWALAASLEPWLTKRRFSSQSLLGLVRLLLLASLVAMPLAWCLPANISGPLGGLLWIKPISAVAPLQFSVFHPPSMVALPSSRAIDPTITLHWEWLLLVVLVPLAGVRVFRLTASLRSIRRTLQNSTHWKALGSVSIHLSPSITVPFSFRGLKRFHVVLPQDMIDRPMDFKIALAHELQHHRQHDSTWVLVLEFLAVAMPFFPWDATWSALFREVQELACDEAVLKNHSYSPEEYGGCLLRVAESALFNERILCGTASMAASGTTKSRQKAFLTRRILMLTNSGKKQKKRILPWTTQVGMALMATFALVTVAYASKGTNARRPLTLQAAQELVQKMKVTPGFRVEVNELVLKQLNQVITSPEKCAETRSAMERMEKLKLHILPVLEKYGHPAELLAVPLVESMYNESAKQTEAPYCAGLWQFVPETARNYGLTVDDKIDQRLDVQLGTDAAMRLLGANHLRFQDWLLSLAAYNQGEKAVEQAIAKGKTRDPWKLVESEKLNNYLVLTTAAVILIGNPKLVE